MTEIPTTAETTAECPDCGVKMQESNDGVAKCPYCNSWAFRDAVSDGAIYAAASKPTALDALQYYPTTLTKQQIKRAYLDSEIGISDALPALIFDHDMERRDAYQFLGL